MAPMQLHAWELPRLRYSLSFEDDNRYFADVGPDTEFFDVKFYPYSPPGSNPVFAAVSKRHIFVCRLSQTKDSNPCEVLQVIRDDDDGALNCSCTWTKDPETEQALLCVAGRDAKVKIYKIGEQSEAFLTFVGHGGEINDLATSPANPHLVASASDDTTVRIWSLDPVHRRQPCVCLLGGEGHSWNLLSVAFHDSGRYVLSAGHDQVINLWTLPDIPESHMENPIVVHYPHFSSSEIHTGLIDCVAFYGDLILSRACHEDVIVLWRIEGFSSDDPPPLPEQAPSTHDTSRLTRSAFSALPAVPSSSTATSSVVAQYTRLLQLHTPGCGPQFFMRFGLFHVAGHHPTLAFCNAATKIYFWDFACFAAYRQFITKSSPQQLQQQRPPWLRPVISRKRPASMNPPPNGTHAGARRRLRETNGSGFNLRDVAAERVDASDRDSSVFSSTVAGAGGGTTTATGNAGTPDPEKHDKHDKHTDSPTTVASAGKIEAASSNGNGNVSITDIYNKETLEDWKSKYDTADPHVQIKAHKTETAKGMPIVGRQVAWSPEGEWCVVVGSNSRIMILQRWAKGDAAHAKEDGVGGADKAA
ncbi:embryonic ectoderm development protein [Niveomyces insectorum RCEF 264]|uniref:Embryonic ectoderm development protein n=1 Tax=Niveomyces insectorum RCEF 264 TaxID=1081102 RepID=A0A162MMX7_9HYPO|nr:embryonic ectoderm development protein [Niveomyces insectorum RCEF 264]